MSLETWAMFFLAYIIVTLSPGPNVLLVVKNSVQYGAWSALATVFGNLFCQLIIVGLVAVGVGELLTRLPIWFSIMKCAGGFYLIYLGIKSFRQARKSSFVLTNTDVISSNKSSIALFKEAFLVSASNPKTMIFLSAFLPQFLDTNHSYLGQFVVMYLSICVIVMSIHLAYAFTTCYVGQKLSTKNFEDKLAKMTGGLFVGMGGGILFSSKS
ncbi:TPA: LysE family translocator [Vibrio parahaemolyticus]|uniref:LysE family translocator n=2 Tax=Vibrio parahaemolyticus TaxID=670 RepID=UPI003B670E81|nr:LysE family translocator [Vibrio parahaemolyticus]HCH0770788.1 LysE family translocator [Vibrio parahaemolyticus]HCH1006627.1 LysE family translocator [Vibrio parahaemolyticus]HCM1289180.1 LysE family translocator [Vibrio parahaemolyticus]